MRWINVWWINRWRLYVSDGFSVVRGFGVFRSSIVRGPPCHPGATDNDHGSGDEERSVVPLAQGLFSNLNRLRCGLRLLPGLRRRLKLRGYRLLPAFLRSL